MTRAALHLPGSGTVQRLRTRSPRAGIPPISFDDPRLGIALAHVAALAVSVLILALQNALFTNGDVLIWLAIFLGLSVLRTATVGKGLAQSSLVLDAAGVAIFLAGTGAPASPFYVLALAGVWWASHEPRPRSGLTYGLAFSLVYLVLVVPVALRDGTIAGVFEGVAAMVVISALADWFIRVDRRAIALNEALHATPFGAEQLAIREGLVRALHTMDIPVDVVLTAGQVGLSAVQAELLSYLMLGLSNFEISDAAGVSEATVRYRLTRLYRTLGVRGRRDAAERAKTLGLSGGTGATKRPK